MLQRCIHWLLKMSKERNGKKDRDFGTSNNAPMKGGRVICLGNVLSNVQERGKWSQSSIEESV